MRKFAFLSAAAAAIAIACPAAAQSRAMDAGRVYVGAGYTQLDADDIDVGGVTGRVGYRFTPNLGVEGEATFGVDDDTAQDFGVPIDVELDNQWGVYGVGFVPITPSVEAFGRVGYVQVEAQGSVGGFTAGVDEDGIGFGGGVQWHATDHFAVRGDYTRLEGDDDGVNAYAVSGVWTF
ncbi:MAG: outer membrane beta-barrel protein [Alphaproteobacteria bacterium]|nr:outer membrane beta-barrel protein [Alphaproteobacteria bacterium]